MCVIAFSRSLRAMAASRRPLKVSQERLQMYAQQRSLFLSSGEDGDGRQPEADPYAFVDGDVEFTFRDKKDRQGGDREVGKKYKVGGARGPCASPIGSVS